MSKVAFVQIAEGLKEAADYVRTSPDIRERAERLSKREEDQKTIDRWRAAYAARVPDRPVPFIKMWSPGWYYFTDAASPKRYRISQIADMCERLEKRLELCQ